MLSVICSSVKSSVGCLWYSTSHMCCWYWRKVLLFKLIFIIRMSLATMTIIIIMKRLQLSNTIAFVQRLRCKLNLILDRSSTTASLTVQASQMMIFLTINLISLLINLQNKALPLNSCITGQHPSIWSKIINCFSTKRRRAARAKISMVSSTTALGHALVRVANIHSLTYQIKIHHKFPYL